jgi:NADH-quinone oxidoreductase subunit D
MTDDRKIALPPRHELATSMEALIHHFKLVTEGFRVPPGEVYFPIEGPRGEYAVFLRSDGSSKPARVHMRDPSFVNLQATKAMVQDSYIADLIATLAMMDPVLGGIDR